MGLKDSPASLCSWFGKVVLGSSVDGLRGINASHASAIAHINASAASSASSFCFVLSPLVLLSLESRQYISAITERLCVSQDEMFFVTSGDANIRSKTDLAIPFS